MKWRKKRDKTTAKRNNRMDPTTAPITTVSPVPRFLPESVELGVLPCMLKVVMDEIFVVSLFKVGVEAT